MEVLILLTIRLTVTRCEYGFVPVGDPEAQPYHAEGARNRESVKALGATRRQLFEFVCGMTLETVSVHTSRLVSLPNRR